MKLLVAARLNSEYKLRTTLDPIIQLDIVEKVYLVRRYPINLPKTVCYSPPALFRKFILTTEIYRVLIIFYLCLFKRPDCLMGIHFILHCVYVALAKIVFRIPLIMLIIESPDKYRKNSVFNFFVRQANLIGVRGQHSLQFLADTAGVDKRELFVTPDVHDFDIQVNDTAMVKDYDLVFVGYYTKAKRIDILLEVIEKVKDKCPDVSLALIGDGPLKEMVQSKMQSLGLKDNVDCLGHVQSIYPYLKKSKAFIMTSQTEGLPTVLLEALSFELPFIVPDVGDIKDIAVNDYNALVVEPLNVDQFAQACTRLLSDPELYQRLKANSAELRSKLQTRHSYPAVQEVWNDKLRALIQ